MDDNLMVNLDVLLGSIKIVQVAEQRGTDIWMGGYSIHYDRHGKETHRTETKWNCRVECYDRKTVRQMVRLVPSNGVVSSCSAGAPRE